MPPFYMRILDNRRPLPLSLSRGELPIFTLGSHHHGSQTDKAGELMIRGAHGGDSASAEYRSAMKSVLGKHFAPLRSSRRAIALSGDIGGENAATESATRNTVPQKRRSAGKSSTVLRNGGAARAVGLGRNYASARRAEFSRRF